MSEPGRVRFRFEKLGRACFISHLDLQRTLARSFVRAEIPLWYTEGFNPHPYISLLRPLSVGYESVCELGETVLTVKIDAEALRAAVNRCAPEGLRLTELYEGGRPARELCWSEYEIVVTADTVASGFAKKFENLFNNPVFLEKKSKRGAAETDISTMVKSAAARERGGGILLRVTVRDAADGGLNPAYVVRAAANAGLFEPVAARYRRVAMLGGELAAFR